jgi:hypothetical protein
MVAPPLLKAIPFWLGANLWTASLDDPDSPCSSIHQQRTRTSNNNTIRRIFQGKRLTRLDLLPTDSIQLLDAFKHFIILTTATTSISSSALSQHQSSLSFIVESCLPIQRVELPREQLISRVRITSEHVRNQLATVELTSRSNGQVCGYGTFESGCDAPTIVTFSSRKICSRLPKTLVR